VKIRLGELQRIIEVVNDVPDFLSTLESWTDEFINREYSSLISDALEEEIAEEYAVEFINDNIAECERWAMSLFSGNVPPPGLDYLGSDLWQDISDPMDRLEAVVRHKIEEKLLDHSEDKTPNNVVSIYDAIEEFVGLISSDVKVRVTPASTVIYVTLESPQGIGFISNEMRSVLMDELEYTVDVRPRGNAFVRQAGRKHILITQKSERNKITMTWKLVK